MSSGTEHANATATPKDTPRRWFGNAVQPPSGPEGVLAHPNGRIYVAGAWSGNVVAYEKPENHKGEGTVVLFLDSHVEFMTLEAFEQALNATQERLRPSVSDGKTQP